MASYFEDHNIQSDEDEQSQEDSVGTGQNILHSYIFQQLSQEGMLDVDTMNTLGMQQGTPPISKQALREMTTIYLTKKQLKKLQDDDLESCIICQEDFQVDDCCNELPCKHQFHRTCLENWLTKHATCPLCRHEFQTDDPEYEEKKLDKSRLEENIHSMYM